MLSSAEVHNKPGASPTRRMLLTMNIILATSVMATLLLSSGSVANAALCDLDSVKLSAVEVMPGGWSSTNHRDDAIVKLMQDAVTKAKMSSNEAVPLTQHRDVIEAYAQVVDGMNYCIRFSASGNCANYHCKSYECTASGHRPLRSNDLENVEVRCQVFTGDGKETIGYLEGVIAIKDWPHYHTQCNVDEIRENSKRKLAGGWFNAPQDDERVRKLYETSSRLAAVEGGSVAEAYYQVVRGSNYCIQFTSHSSGNCGDNCKPLRCVAGGFYPISDGNVNSEIATKVGVNCQPHNLGAAGKLGSSGQSSTACHLSATVLTILIALFIGIMFE